MSCTIRKATPWDLPRIREIYEVARQFMRKNGNHSQWGKGDEPEALIEEDICQGNLYVLEKADIHAVFAFIIGEDPTYLENRRRKLKSKTLGCRASCSQRRNSAMGVLGQFRILQRTSAAYFGSIHIRDNKVMQHVLEKYGFVSCGIVHVPDGSRVLHTNCSHNMFFDKNLHYPAERNIMSKSA